MKINNILAVAFGIASLVFSSCDPIEDRDELTNSFDPNNIKLEAIQTGNNGNGITLKMETPGIVGYWDYNIDKKYTDCVKFNYPISGTATFTYHVTTAYIDGSLTKLNRDIKKEIKVDIKEFDQPLADSYYNLVGKDLKSKTWVFNGVPNDGKLWWYMCPGNDPSKYEEAWWNAGGTGGEPVDATGKMTFDLSGAANFTYYASADAEAIKGGSFSFNLDYTKLYISGEKKILGNEEPRGNAKGEYTIIKLTEDEMILYVPTNGGNTGWCWRFKPAD